ncbi:hypothetical protein NG701_19410 [Pseudarthrobacter sp. HLT3-5]|uniref:hypothetical protein n=1 Tax=Pseudarthrobacter cellobiosi TaxID=2953654 RepID=UPI00208F888C|nr:hypothetical protein [Pseudarthrobacter sp. HLT3-5]MCO4276558.1 hypothetical protein [Pseudarthrobacter sp. HLT3-5]
MTFAFENLTLGIDRLIGLDAATPLTANEVLPGPALVIAGASASTTELRHAPSDALIARSVEDFRSIQFVEIQHFVVTADGFSLALELLEPGHLNPASHIVWSLDLPLLESLERLNAIGLPETVTVRSIGGDMESSVVTTAGGSGLSLDFDGFRAGLEAGAKLAGGEVQGNRSDGDSETDHALALLRRKHLSVLESLSPVDAAKPVAGLQPETPAADATRLENDLILLKRRYDALDRKYTALSNSRLGALTLRLWARKNPRQNKAISAKDGDK